MYKIMECAQTGAKMLVNDNENNSNLKQAGVLLDGQNGIAVPDEEILETFLAFSENRPYSSQYTEAVAKRNNNVFQAGQRKSIKQAAAASDIDMLQTLMEFGGYS